MNIKRWRPDLSPEFTGSVRAYAVDLASSALIFLSVSIMAGRVWRFPFDDELLMFRVAGFSQSAFDFLLFFLKGGDIHPPLAFFGFYGLFRLGFADWGIRLCSLAMTALALGLFHSLCLTLIARRAGAVGTGTRLIAILLFGLWPLAVSVGDAIRWYPPFAVLIALFVVLYAFAANPAARLWSAVALGLAASTNFLAIFVAVPFALYRYTLERQFRLAFDFGFWLIVSLFASLGLITAYSSALHGFGSVTRQQAGLSYLRVAATDALGFFGGDAVGVGNAWIVVPVAIIAAIAMVSAIDRERPSDPAHLLLLMLGAIPIMGFADFVSPRSFLYLAPAVATIVTLFLNRSGIDAGARLAVLAAALMVAASVGAIATIDHGTRPFKRNAAIPFEAIVDFIKTNGKGHVLVVSSDPVLAWTLQHDGARPDLCASYFMENKGCFWEGQNYDTVFVASGQSHRSRRVAFMRNYENAVALLIAGRQKMASMPAGLDDDAALKSRLTGVALDKYILTIDLYR
jgi:hypothetical protein